jgi:hypothetical protein
MKNSAGLRNKNSQEDIYSEIYFLIKENGGSWQSAGAFLGLVGAFLSPIAGILLNLIAWQITFGNLKSFLIRTSLVLLALFLPLSVLGAHCLDLIEKKIKSQNFPRI